MNRSQTTYSLAAQAPQLHLPLLERLEGLNAGRHALESDNAAPSNLNSAGTSSTCALAAAATQLFLPLLERLEGSTCSDTIPEPFPEPDSVPNKDKPVPWRRRRRSSSCRCWNALKASMPAARARTSAADTGGALLPFGGAALLFVGGGGALLLLSGGRPLPGLLSAWF